MTKTRAAFGGLILLYFVIGLEIAIMISPFAAFFYAAFNPFLLALAKYQSTRWLTAFFLPHMVLPPGLFLKTVRVSGSVLFVAGPAIFLLCAGQVYYGKFFRKGVALQGLYSRIRHPQYMGLGLTGLGLSILWPRFLVVALWVIMLVLYYVLARGEERRMINRYGALYRDYMAGTGMFFPKAVECAFLRFPLPRSSGARAVIALFLLAASALGGAFALRAYTVSRLPLWSDGRVTAIAILPDDLHKLDHRMADVLLMPEIKARLQESKGPSLVYFMPKDYVMQGMIADTGGEWKLFKQNHTFAMIAGWIFHPFRHLEGNCPLMRRYMRHEADIPGERVVRRMIFLRVVTTDGGGPSELFAIGARRVPLFVADVDIHNLVMKDIKDLPAGTGWGSVPTPVF